jgi:LacI family transcriptional regulator
MPASRPRSNYTIATIFPLDTAHGHGLLRGVAAFVRKHPRLRVVRFGFIRPEVLTRKFLERLEVDGLIVKIGAAAEEELVVRRGLPAVNISGEIATPRVPTVNTDDRLLGRLSAQYFHRRGYRTLAYNGNAGHRASVLRGEGLREEARSLGLQPANILVRLHPRVGRLDRLRREFIHWLKRLPRPAGLLTFDDFEAYEAAVACEQAGLRVPDDIGIIGVGNNPTRLELSPVALSAIELNTPLIGQQAAELLFRQLQGRRIPVDEHLVKPLKFITRHSTDIHAVDDEIVSRALEHIREHVGNTLYVDEIARTVGCSRRTLELRFRASLGTSVYAEVQRQHLEHAKELLADPALKLADVASASGYEDVNHLGLAFRRQLGTTPGRFRTAMRADAAGGPEETAANPLISHLPLSLRARGTRARQSS